MTALELRFLAGRFHATPWGRHVNEGAVEWPPSPWRLLRALIATWHLKARQEVPLETVASLVSKLAETHPFFFLPPARLGHTRHYMPFNEGKNEKTTKVFDTFIQMAPDTPVVAIWDVLLTPDQKSALHVLSSRLGFLGRAESIVEARIGDSADFQINARPIPDAPHPDPALEVVQVLAAQPPEDYQKWRKEFMDHATASLGPKPTQAQRKKLPSLPESLFDALHADTGDLQGAGWSHPPGSAAVSYGRNAGAFAPRSRGPRERSLQMPTVARYAIVSTACPRLTQTISVTNRVHEALCKWSDQSPVFTGKNPSGGPLLDHGHAHIFCESNGPQDTITHLTVWAKDGFDEKACLALRRLNKVWGHGGHDLRLILLGLGSTTSFPECPLFGRSKTWRSYTPFVSTRHAKTYRDGRPKMDESGWQIGSTAHDLLRLIGLNPEIGSVTIQQQKGIFFGSKILRCIQFQTIRHSGGGSRGKGEAAAFRLMLDSEWEGPLALGFGAHFGLGLFVPDRNITDP